MNMDGRTESPEEICTRGQAIYDNRIKGLVDSAHKGKFVAIDVDTGEYEIDKRDLAACQHLVDGLPNAAIHVVRVGRPTPYRMIGMKVRSRA